MLRFNATAAQHTMLSSVALPNRYRSGLITTFMIALPALYLVHMWLGYHETWIHPELLGTSAYVWNFPESEHFSDRLRKVFDWKAFDPNVNRVRPLNDVAEVIDGIARPYLARFFVPHPSLTPLALLTVVFSLFLLFHYFREFGFDSVRTGALLAVFISSVGFLSVIVAYIRPAKKLTLLLFFVSLYFAQRHTRERTSTSFWAFVLSLYLSFFVDEMDLIKYFIFGVLFFPSLLRTAAHWKRLTFLSLPILFLIAVMWGLPAIYASFSVHGPWDALADSKKFAVFGYLTEPYFYWVGLIHTARALLTTVGVPTHSTINELLVLAVLTGGTALLVYQGRLREETAKARYGLIAITVSLFAAAFYATLLDWYPFPQQLSYLGSFTFYYHSFLSILVVLWLAFAWETLFRIGRNHIVVRQAILGSGILVCAAVTVANFAMFHHVNRLVQIIHIYPYSTESMHNQIMARLPDIRAARRGEVVTVVFVREQRKLSSDFDSELLTLFGAGSQHNDFYKLFNEFKLNPIMKDNYLEMLLHAYFPYNKFAVQVR